jgi:hypothetical protein
LGDVLSLKHSLHRKATDAKGFYLLYSGLILFSAIVVLIPGSPLGLITEAVQTLAGVLLPSATVFLLLLCNDRAVLGPWVNGRWLTLFTGAVISVLLLLSVVLTAAVLFPDISARAILWILGAGAALGLLGVAATARAGRPAPAPAPAPLAELPRAMWRMPPLSELSPPMLSRGTKLWMGALRLYLVAAVGMVVVRVVQLALSGGV